MSPSKWIIMEMLMASQYRDISEHLYNSRVVDYCRRVVLGFIPTGVPPVGFWRVGIRPLWLEFVVKLIKTERSMHILKQSCSFREENSGNNWPLQWYWYPVVSSRHTMKVKLSLSYLECLFWPLAYKVACYWKAGHVFCAFFPKLFFDQDKNPFCN